MIIGLYSAASAMVAGVNRQQALAHNIANLETPGFKQLVNSLDEYLESPVVYNQGVTPNEDPLNLIGMQGLGVMLGPETTDFSQGPLNATDQPLDLAIQGDGFFRLQTAAGERYTRDGRFLRNIEGQITSMDGHLLLGANGQPITIPDGEISIGPDGTITVNGETAGQIGLVSFADPVAELTRAEGNLFSAAGAPTGETTGQIQQGYLEASNGNTAQMMGQMVSVARAYEAAQRMVQTQDELMGTTIAKLGSV